LKLNEDIARQRDAALKELYDIKTEVGFKDQEI
jgi:hypothetical protein